MITAADKFSIQASQYAFPYHYISGFDAAGTFINCRPDRGAVDYMTYMTAVCDLVQSLKPGSLLDVGTGDGRLINMLSPRLPGARIEGVDPVPQAIALARAFNPGIKFFEGVAADVEGCFDCVTAIEVMEHIPDEIMDSFVKQMHDRLKSQGTLVVSVPSVNLPLSKKHFRHYDIPLLTRHLGSRFEITSSRYVMRRNLTSKIIRRLLVNSCFVLTSRTLLQLAWSYHRSNNFDATDADGTHLIVTASPRTFKH